MTGTQATHSVWQTKANKPVFSRLEKDLTVDVAIVGAGITGLTTAMLLHQAGCNVAIVDADEVGGGVSGNNSGHLTTMLQDLRYTTIQAHFGNKGAQLAADSQLAAVSQIEDLIQRYQIDCHFKTLSGYLYTEDPSRVAALQRECEAAAESGIRTFRTENIPLPFQDDIIKGIMVPDQARFDPYAYCLGLANVLHAGGVEIFENSRVRDFSDHIPMNVKTDHGCIIADNLVLATHTPIGFLPVIQSKLKPYRSYVIGIRCADAPDDALFWDMQQPYHYLRILPDNVRDGRPLVLIGGEDHPVGESRPAELAFENLERYARERFTDIQVENRWSAQLYEPVDGLPYIGRYGHEQNLYLATGFTGEGLTCGTIAAMMISDQIRHIPNPWSRLYDANRLKPMASAKELIQQNLHVVESFIGDRLKKEPAGDREQVLRDIQPGEGILASVDGSKCAFYCDETGAVHEMSAVCSHARCHVHWNGTEKSWDCPCHGGRFSATGDVLNGPPTEALEKRNVHRPTPRGFL